MREIVITINEAFNQENCCEYAKVLITGKNGKKRSRIVSMESLLKAMQKSLVIKREGVAVRHNIRREFSRPPRPRV